MTPPSHGTSRVRSACPAKRGKGAHLSFQYRHNMSKCSIASESRSSFVYGRKLGWFRKPNFKLETKTPLTFVPFTFCIINKKNSIYYFMWKSVLIDLKVWTF